MRYPTIVLDASIRAAEALSRLAGNGLWLDANEPRARGWIDESARCFGVLPKDVEQHFRRDPALFRVAIRRQWVANILWYDRRAEEVLYACSAQPETSLALALNLHEHDSRPPYAMPESGLIPEDWRGVILGGGQGVTVCEPAPASASPATPPLTQDAARGFSFDLPAEWPGAARHGTFSQTRSLGAGLDEALIGGGDDFDLGADVAHQQSGPRSIWRGEPNVPSGASLPQPPAQPIRANVWPTAEAPSYVAAGVSFELIVGLALDKPAGSVGMPFKLEANPAHPVLEMSVEVSADGLEAPGGWCQPMPVDVRDPGAARAVFTLQGLPPDGPDPKLTMLEVRFVLDGMVRGVAARPLIIGPAAQASPGAAPDKGTPWLDQPFVATPVELGTTAMAPDLTIEIARRNGDLDDGLFTCWLRSPHAIALDPGPHPIALGTDAKSFAGEIVTAMRLYGAGGLGRQTMKGLGRRIAGKLPAAVFNALALAAQAVGPAVPTVLIASAESYVPWELATFDPPLDAQRPALLGAQARVGRWLRPSLTSPRGAGLPARVVKPPVLPPDRIEVRHMAVMAGMYKPESGLARLVNAEAEASDLVATYGAVPLAASPEALAQLLEAQVTNGFQAIGGVDAVHFAGHGNFDPTRTDSAQLFLSDGTPLSSLLFYDTSYGGTQQPLIFLNACMSGIGGAVLGEVAGFPGDCMHGGFGGVIGALWEVDDALAGQIAKQFWLQALPSDGQTAVPVAEILRDLRAKYTGNPPPATVLAYVFYGHPNLTLSRAP